MDNVHISRSKTLRRRGREGTLKRGLLFALGALVLAAAATVVFRAPLAVLAFTPGGQVQRQAAPAAPDYALAASWTALPGVAEPARATPTGVTAVASAAAPVDVFFIHPTTYGGSDWNAPVSELTQETDRLESVSKASVFNGCCAVYAPRYRQANAMAFVADNENTLGAADIAYGDVRRAFEHFLAHYSGDRPFIIASHSQGSVMAARLLREEVVGRPLQRRLVAAYVIGGRVAVGEIPGLPVCGAPDQTGCLVGWNTRSDTFVRGPLDFPPGAPRVCVNPLSWRTDGAAAKAELNRGAAFLDKSRDLHRAFADAQCRGDFLVARDMGEIPSDAMGNVLAFLIGPGNYHLRDYEVFWMNLRENALARSRAYLDGAG